jgi:acetyl-CoA acetyltransferase
MAEPSGTIDASSPKYLRDRYAIIGIGDTPFMRGSGMTTRQLATWALRNAIADAGIKPSEIDGMLSYSSQYDSTFAYVVASDLAIRLNFYMDLIGGGSAPEAAIGLAMGAIEAGMCKTVAIYRALNGYSGLRMGGTGRIAPAISGGGLHGQVYGMASPAQMFSHTFMRHMHDYGTTPEQVAMVKVFHSRHAANNPRAYFKTPVTVDEVLSSRVISTPVHFLECCLETDCAGALIITKAERAKDYRQPPVHILSVVGRCSKPRADMHYQHGPISTVAGAYGREILWPNAGLGPDEVDVTGAYDAMTFTSMLQLEDYGFCKKGEGGNYVGDGTIALGGRRPNNTSGGQLCEGYSHGMGLIIENIRQLRGDVDDSCSVDERGRRNHTYNYAAGGCRQVPKANVSANLGWATPATGSALVLRRG